MKTDGLNDKECLHGIRNKKGEIGMPGPLLLSVIILSSLMIGITQFFHHTDTTEEVKDKVRLVFPIFIVSISICFLLNKDGYIVVVFHFS